MSGGPGFVPDPFVARRRPSFEVNVGGVGIGGTNPIRIQSMTTTDTKDTRATADQVERLTEAGCEIVRITAPSITEAENLREIKAELARRGVRVPLVADIHFTPNAALIAAESVEKVRINPGNYADKKKFALREYDDAQYAAELERVAERFRPLVRSCRERGVALRIGTNHGSLSDRIMSRFGDTPLGMVESALEFLDVCEAEGFRAVVFSMKASSTQVAIQAYRLLAARLAARAPGEPSYPFHVGVTEAGLGEDGRIKSAIGIGSLLEDGIGDTIRVSLTEDPCCELPVAAMLARHAEARWARDANDASSPRPTLPFVGDPYSHTRRSTKSVTLGGLMLGGREPVRVELDLGELPQDPDAAAARLATSLAALTEVACESLRVSVPDASALARLSPFRASLEQLGVDQPLAVSASAELLATAAVRPARWAIPVDSACSPPRLEQAAAAARAADVAVEWCLRGDALEIPVLAREAIEAGAAAGLSAAVLSVESRRSVHAVRALCAQLRELGAADTPLLLRHARGSEESDESAALQAAIALGAPLCDGIGDAVCLAGFPDPGRAVDLAYRILQGARVRTTRTEYISCPSCGRTLFDLEETTARIQRVTSHLRGVKIAIMGCIVNGPGEMADADFGYVGSGPGLITLYAGKQIIARAVPEAEAPDRLLDLIRRSRSSGVAEWRRPGGGRRALRGRRAVPRRPPGSSSVRAGGARGRSARGRRVAAPRKAGRLPPRRARLRRGGRGSRDRRRPLPVAPCGRPWRSAPLRQSRSGFPPPRAPRRARWLHR